MEKVLFLVPHEDDELFVGGPLLISLARSPEYEVFVFIATNGDSVPYESKCRIKESINVLNEIGISSSNIFFGGYGDSWDGVHIYNMEENTVKTSHAGHKETYFPLKKGAEWHFLKTGEHALYTKKSYFEDIKLLISDICPEVIICVDMDVNSDHRCLSLLTDAAIGEILKERPDYKPTYLKKYSYMGVLFGPNDYFIYPNAETKMTERSCFNPYFLWNDRIRYSVPEDCNTLFAKDNILYKLSKLYKSQEIRFSVGRFVNSDVVFWKRNTDNIVLNSLIEVSSGEVSYLNDFLLLDSENISVRDCDYSKKCWRPDKDDRDPFINISFDRVHKIKNTILYFNNRENVGKAKIVLSFFDSSGSLVQNKEISILKEGMYYEKVYNDCCSEVNRVLISVIGADFCGIGITEIEVLEREEEVPFTNLLYIDKREEMLDDYKRINAKKQTEKAKLDFQHIVYKYFDLYCWKRLIYRFIKR